MNIIVFFTNNGSPATGLTPTVNVRKLDGTLLINADAMTEVGDGFYKYDFSGYDEDEDYCIRCYGDPSLPATERYKFATNETANTGRILKIEKNKWKIQDDIMTIFDDDGTTALYQFDLLDESGVPTSESPFERRPK